MQPVQIDEVAMSCANSQASEATEHDAVVNATVGIADLAVFKFGLRPDAGDTMRECFVRYCVRLYNKMNWKGSTSSDYFAEGFLLFDTLMFARVSSASRYDLRDTLREQGVYVKKGHQIFIPDALVKVVQNDLPWPDDYDQAPRDENVTTIATNSGQGSVRPVYGSNSDSSRHIASIWKSYHGTKDRYRGNEEDNFNHKYNIFKESCEQNGLEEMECLKAFLVTLTGRALQFYFNNYQGKRATIYGLYNGVRKPFMTKEHARVLWRKWNSISLATVMSRNANKKGT